MTLLDNYEHNDHGRANNVHNIGLDMREGKITLTTQNGDERTCIWWQSTDDDNVSIKC